MMHVSEDICSTFRGREQDFYEKAFLNILSDFADDRIHMQNMQRAVLNILDDFHADGVQLRDIQSAVINILEDSAAEKIQLERTQRAVLNILDDVESERNERKQAEERVRALNEELEARVLQRTAALSAANQELESFAYSVSHDLRAPLRAIDGFSKILLEDYGTVVGDEGKDALNRVRAAAQRMGLLIDDMLKLSRSTRGDIELEVIDLSAMAKTIIGRLSTATPRETMQVSIAEGIAAMGDPRLLDAVLENLLSNAWKFTGKTALPTISFSAVARDGEMVCRIADNGAGFEMAFAHNLFLPFQRLHRPTEFPGNGIGLATVKRIIARLGGQVWGEGAVDKGATFYFTLPAASARG